MTLNFVVLFGLIAVQIDNSKFSSLALLRCKSKFSIFELGLIAVQTDFKIFELGLIAVQTDFKIFELGLIAVQIGFAVLPCNNLFKSSSEDNLRRFISNSVYPKSIISILNSVCQKVPIFLIRKWCRTEHNDITIISHFVRVCSKKPVAAHLISLIFYSHIEKS